MDRDPGSRTGQRGSLCQVQRRLVENAKFSPRNTKEPVLLQGLLMCDVCGYAYTRTSQGPGPKKYRYYRCPGINGWELPQGKVCSSRPLRAPDLVDFLPLPSGGGGSQRAQPPRAGVVALRPHRLGDPRYRPDQPRRLRRLPKTYGRSVAGMPLPVSVTSMT
ncbi:zinc ribbon domain-containing protein, partial [Streptomyces minutiscleroticus]|uniref:zinc ribbon domain-containing protein n=1 Tax=Streptomyces minutiscleroticus TaxID=68238 RepID=UPI00332F4126